VGIEFLLALLILAAFILIFKILIMGFFLLWFVFGAFAAGISAFLSVIKLLFILN